MNLKILFQLKKKSLWNFFSFFFLGFFIFSLQTVSAITLSPTRQTAIIDGGKTQTVKITLTNEEKQTVTAKGVVEGFEIDEKTNRAKFGIHDEAVEWATISPSVVTLSAGETKDIVFTFRVPETAKTGVHYIGLFALVSSEGGQVGISSRVGSLLFLYTSGNFEEKSDVLDFSAGSMWYTTKQANIFLTLNNSGTIHVQPRGEVSIKNWRGKIVGVYPINPQNHLLLPQKKFDTVFDVSLGFQDIGKLQAHLQYIYGVNEQIVVKESTFWFFPLSVIIGGAFFLIVVLFLLLVLGIKITTQKK